MAAKLRLDHPGIAAILKSAEVAGVVDGAAASVGSAASGHVTAQGVTIPVVVDSYVTDRAAAGVTLRHPAGLAVEAKHGVLAGAAAATGLEVTRRGA